MRVINPSEIEVKCSCGALLGVTASDIIINEVHGPYCSCSCPECGQRITLDHKKIPGHMKRDWPE